jgi:predicted nuclease of predicted toxin-antitoxin system
LSPRLVDTLRETISDVVHVSSLGLHAAADSTLLHAAEADGRVLVTLDGDFSTLLAHGRLGAPSVIHMRSQGLVAPASQALAIVDALEAYADELLAGAIVTIRDRQMVCRRLPLP